MAYNFKVQSRLTNFKDGQVFSTTVIVVDTNSLLQIPAELLGDYSQTNENEVIEAVLNDLHKTLFVDRALPDYIKTTDENIKRLEKLEGLYKSLNTDLVALRTFVFKKDKDTVSEATVDKTLEHDAEIEIEN